MLKIVGWTHWDDFRFQEDTSCGPDDELRRRLIAAELRKKGYRFNGCYHQDGEFGVPVFNDGTTYQCSQRMWGGIMAMAYPEEVKKGTEGAEYVFWAWHHQDQRCVFPTWAEVKNDYGFDPAGCDM